MPFDLTLSSPAYSASGKFGSCLNGGFGRVAGLHPTGSVYTFEAWVKTTNTNASNRLVFGLPNILYCGLDATHRPLLEANGASSAVGAQDALNDGNWHHFRVVGTSDNVRLFIDGVLKRQRGQGVALSGVESNILGIGEYGSFSGFQWQGQLDDAAVYSTSLNTVDFAVPTAAVASNAAGLLGLYRFENNGLNSQGVVENASAVTLTASASSVSVGVAVTITAGTNAALTGAQSQVVTFGCNVAGSFSPASVTLNSATATATSTFTPSASGSATVTGTSTGTLTLSQGSVAITIVVNALDTTKVLFSPYNWNIGADFAKSINPGAYFSFEFGGSSCKLLFNMAGITGVAPSLVYRVDNYGPWVSVLIAAEVVISIPTAVSPYQNHLLEVVFNSASGAVSRWSPQLESVHLTGIVLSGANVITKTNSKPLRGLIYGDSITESSPSVSSTIGDSSAGYAMVCARLLGADVGVVGFGYQGFTHLGNGSVPIFGDAYLSQYAGVARSLASEPDFIVINQGTNDGANNIVSAATAIFTNLLSITSRTFIFVLRPFGGEQASNLSTAVSGINNSRLIYVDTTGWKVSADYLDGVHPNLFAHAQIGEKLANVIRAKVAPLRGVRTLRNASINLVDSGNAAQAGLTGLKWAWYDQARPDLLTVAADQGSAESTDGSGVLTIPIFTTLTPGAVGWLVVSDSDGTVGMAHKAFSGPVVVS